MFLPKHFAQTDSERIHKLMVDNPFVLLCTTVDSEIEASHVPVHTSLTDGGETQIRFHLALNNPLVKAFDGTHGNAAAALIVFTGPNTYISPDWYGTAEMVPTWNYAVVHARGIPVRLDDDALSDLLDDLSADNEAKLAPKKPWTAEKMDQGRYASMRRAIVGYSMIATTLDAKWKMNQNRKPQERAGVKAVLAETDGDVHQAVRDEIPD